MAELEDRLRREAGLGKEAGKGTSTPLAVENLDQGNEVDLAAARKRVDPETLKKKKKELKAKKNEGKPREKTDKLPEVLARRAAEEAAKGDGKDKKKKKRKRSRGRRRRRSTSSSSSSIVLPLVPKDLERSFFGLPGARQGPTAFARCGVASWAAFSQRG